MLKNLNSCPVCSNQNSFQYERTLNNYQLVKCPQCSFVFADTSAADTLEANSTISHEVDETYQENQTGIDKIWFNYFAKKITKKAPNKGNILDVGCGNGVLLSMFKPLGWIIHGIDLSPWAEKYANIIGYKLFNKLIEETVFPYKFDCIVSTSTYEHVHRPHEHLKKMIDDIKSGGSVWITIPNYNSLSIRWNLSKFDFNQPPFHVNYFTPKSLKYLLKLLQSEYNFQYSIRVYGIPELYSFYIFLNQFASKFKRKNNTAVTPEQSDNTLKGDYKEGKLILFIYKTIVLVNYYVGGFMGVGDRIELHIQKK